MNQLKQVKLSIIALFVFISAVLILINIDILKRESWLSEGQVVRLELAPVDPRSLMQGDYMTLNYAILRRIRGVILDGVQEGYVRVQLDANRRGKFAGIESEYLTLNDANQLLLQFRVRDQRVKLATNAYFFEEGQGSRFEGAKYGEFRVNQKGELLLAALLDAQLNKL